MRHDELAMSSEMTISLSASKLESRSNVFDYHDTNSTTFIGEGTIDDYQINNILSSCSPSLVSPSSSINNSLFEICRCCGKQDCESLDYFNRVVKKLETDTRLAAELGQGLLNQHEMYINESNQQKAHLKEQLKECHEKIQRLELISDEVENEKETILKEKNKWLWEYQKGKKILNETIADLEMSNEKCNQLTKELELKMKEIEKLRLFKFMVKQSESREELLTSKLKDTNQELTICRKNEVLLESKIKKLKMKYESLHLCHEQLIKEVEKSIPTTINHHRDNYKQNTAVIDDINNKISNNTINDLIHLIKELSFTNTKLKSDLSDYKSQLTEAKEEIVILTHKLEEHDERSTSFKEKKSIVLLSKDIKHTLPKRSNTIHLFPSSSNKTKEITATAATTTTNTTTTTTTTTTNTISTLSSTINSNDFINDGLCEMNLSDQQKDLILVSPSTSSIITVQDGELTAIASSEMTKSPYSLLQEHATQILDRLRGSDIRALNRKLKRAFDITELSSMSNSIIDNILMDVDTLESRFLWMNDKRQLFSRDDKVAFFPLLELLKSMLKELGMLKTTMNDFQVEYVKKVEENKMRVEKEIMKGNQQELSIHDDAISSNHHQQQQSSSLSLKRRSSNRPLSWFSSIFSVASNQKSDQIIHHDKQEESTMTDTLLLPNNKQQRHSSLSHHHYSPENQITNTRINRDYYYKSTHSPSNTSHLISTTTTSWLGGK